MVVVIQNVRDSDVEDSNACLLSCQWRFDELEDGEGRHTTERVPTSTLGGTVLLATISEIKFAVMPMIEMSETA